MVYTPDIFVPMAMEPQIEPGNNDLDVRDNDNYFVVGRLKSGVTMPRAQAAFDSIANDLARDYPNQDAGMKLRLSPARQVEILPYPLLPEPTRGAWARQAGRGRP